MLKTDFHIHTCNDASDKYIQYSDEQIINLAAHHKFDVLSFTFHDSCYFPSHLRTYAKKKGILLLPGVEKTIDDKHVLLINYPLRDVKRIEKIRTFQQYRKYLESLRMDDRASLLSVFAHPRAWFRGMGRRVFRNNLDLCDAFEYVSPYTILYDINEDIKRLAKKYKKPLLGDSDAHIIEQFNYTYSLVDAKKTPEAIIRAIKVGKVRLKSTPLPILIFLKRVFFEFSELQQDLKTLFGRDSS